MLLDIVLVFFEFFPSLISSEVSSFFDSDVSENFLGAFFFPIEVNFFFFAEACCLEGWAEGAFFACEKFQKLLDKRGRLWYYSRARPNESEGNGQANLENDTERNAQEIQRRFQRVKTRKC